MEREVQDSEAEVRQHILNCMREGFDSDEDLIERCIDYFVGDPCEAQAKKIVEDEFATIKLGFLKSQTDWPEKTDCDRIDAAFEALTASGIVARHHFTCCNTCGRSEITDEIQAESDRGLRVRGYTFYHWQSTEHAIEDGLLFLNYGASPDDSEENAEAIGREIVDTLHRQNLETSWSGSVEQKIAVKMSWMRRHPPRLSRLT